MSSHTSDSIVDAALLPVEAVSSEADSIQSNVLTLFDGCAPQLLRYVASFGLSAEETEDVVQDTFVALFRHLSLGRDQTNLSGWLFQVAHNLALKRRERILKQRRSAGSNETATQWCVDPAPDPEERLMRRRARRTAAIGFWCASRTGASLPVPASGGTDLPGYCPDVERVIGHGVQSRVSSTHTVDERGRRIVRCRTCEHILQTPR